jgi:hypothetical protein
MILFEIAVESGVEPSTFQFAPILLRYTDKGELEIKFHPGTKVAFITVLGGREVGAVSIVPLSFAHTN